MNIMSNREPIKFDFQSKRESFFTGFMITGIFIGLMVFFIGTGGKHRHPPPNPQIMLTGFIIGFSSLTLFGLLRLFTDDHLLVDPQTEHILLSTQFFFFKTTSWLCPFKDVQYIKLDTASRTVKSGSYTDFFLYLVMKNDKKRSYETVSIPEMPGHQFNDKVVILRDKAVEIAAMIGCIVKYSDKIPPEERLQPSLLKQSLEPEEQKLYVMPSLAKEAPEPPEEVTKIPADKIESDFLCYEDNKICPSCGEKNSQTKYCINCGRML